MVMIAYWTSFLHIGSHLMIELVLAEKMPLKPSPTRNAAAPGCSHPCSGHVLCSVASSDLAYSPERAARPHSAE